ncbi:hypothetical protein [Paenibacillus sp. Soil522]|uniref:hypothetical protein n=1 Tax=Paenibacillus sp. Soil522 TaxID=1736388 RepID=UPI0006F4C7D3|nr:hypothetical protein [Paenibacillus sp. Soil522]KRE31650.1 hypothetical protein ASG81_24835 [Paenibacillus sp. Soil522]
MEDKRTLFKEIVFLFVIVLVMSSLVGCSENKNYTPKPNADMIFLETASSLRELAWNQLSNEEKASVTGDWKEAKVKIVKWDEIPLKKASIKPESIYKVTFNTNKDEMIGPIGIYFDSTIKEIVGYDARM